MFIHDLNLLNNTKFCYNSDTNEIILWIFHDKLYKNGTFYVFNCKNNKLSLVTIRANEYIEQEITMKEIKNETNDL